MMHRIKLSDYGHVIDKRKIAVQDDHLENKRVLRVIVWIQWIVKKYFEELQLGQSKFSCDLHS